MNEPSPPLSPLHPSAPSRSLPWLVVLFVGSGCAALIYEIVWFQLLQMVIGSSAVSLGVLLGTFMGGMCLGSLALPRLIPAHQHPLRVYALIEMAIGVAGVLVLFGIPWIGGIYAASIGYGVPSIALRGLVCAVCLLPPTVLMGATLPAIARWVEATPRGVSWLGFFYASNIVGAVFGCLLAGFYLLRVHDAVVATYLAAGVNAAVALAGLALASRTERPAPAVPATGGTSGDDPTAPSPGSWPVYVAIALSGLCALGAEVVWTRLLSLMLGGTVYTFSIILAVFLVGLGLGSSTGSFLSRGTLPPRLGLGGCQALLIAALGWAAYALGASLPYWPVVPSLSPGPWISFQLDLARCLWATLPATFLWGASFPLALAAVAERGQRDAGRLVGRVYAANTLGAIVGAVGFSTLAIPWTGTQNAQRMLIALCAVAALCVLATLLYVSSRATRSVSVAAVAALAGLIAAAGWVAWGVPAVPGGLVAYGRALPTFGEPHLLYLGEGINASVAVSTTQDGVRSFHVSGKVEASTQPGDMRLQRMLGHLTALAHPAPRSVLVVGCGAGVTAGSFVTHPGVERIVICEIEPLIPRVVARFFGPENHNVLKDRRVTVVYDDARHYLLTTRETFDVITSDPIHPWVKGAAALYTREYFDLCKRRLNPGGVVSQWVPLYETTGEAVRSELATFLAAFPEGTVWGNTINEAGYDTVLLGGKGKIRFSGVELQRRLDRADHRAVARSLAEVEFTSAASLLATYAGGAADLRPWLAGASINRDRDLRLQYLAGMGLNLQRSDEIYAALVKRRAFPKAFFAPAPKR